MHIFGKISTTSKRSKKRNKRNYDAKLLSKDSPFAVSEAFKMLRTNLCYISPSEECAVFCVTSAHAGEGKSIIAANVAVSFAQLGKKVLLIDGDLRCPVLKKVFNIDAQGGLSEILAGIDGDNLHFKYLSSVENLHLITSGRVPPNPSELLASDRMSALIKKEKENYDIIIIDAPPICEVSDAGVMAPLLDGYIFVIRSGYTDIRAVEEAKEIMDQMKATIVGFVLNDINAKVDHYYRGKYGRSGYYYKRRGYGYGYGNKYEIAARKTQNKK